MELALGTVQFGLDYGISNTQGQVSKNETANILVHAKKLGITTLDCAGAYGNSEHLLGEIFTSSQLGEDFDIISKIPALTNVDENINAYFSRSLVHLQQQKIETLLFHHADNLLTHPARKKIFAQALSLKSAGLIERIGVSVYTPEQLKVIAKNFPIEMAQVPLNVFDQRFISSEMISFCQTQKIKLHARSLFLQGLLFIEQDKLAPYFSPYKKKIHDFSALAQYLNCSKLVLALAIAFSSNDSLTAQNSHTTFKDETSDINATPTLSRVIEKLVVGVCNTKQLIDIVEAFELAKHLSVSNNELMALADERLDFINPSLWSV
jgi:aryl-alcohol dehydrogenase-like predicted oxidoreductase